jgi:hypothetical protein
MAKRSPVTAALRDAIAALTPGDCDGLQALIEQGRFDPELATPLLSRPASEVVDTLLRFEEILRFTDTIYMAGDLYPGPWPDVTKKGCPKSRFVQDFSRLPELIGRLAGLDVRLQSLLLATAKTRCEWNDYGMWALRHQPDNPRIRAWVGRLARDRNEYRRGVGERILALWDAL